MGIRPIIGKEGSSLKDCGLPLGLVVAALAGRLAGVDATRLSNIFLALRKPGREVQLCAMYAHILTHPSYAGALLRRLGLPDETALLSVVTELASDGGRADIVLTTERAAAIIEAKVFASIKGHASRAGETQLDEYCDVLRAEHGELRAIAVGVLEPWRATRVDSVHARSRDLIRTLTWNDVAGDLRLFADDQAPYAARIARDFVAMLEEENLASIDLREEHARALTAPALGDALIWARKELEFLASVIGTTVGAKPSPISLNQRMRMRVKFRYADGTLWLLYGVPTASFHLSYAVELEPEGAAGWNDVVASLVDWTPQSYGRATHELSVNLSVADLAEASVEAGIRTRIEKWATSSLAELQAALVATG